MSPDCSFEYIPRLHISLYSLPGINIAQCGQAVSVNFTKQRHLRVSLLNRERVISALSPSLQPFPRSILNVSSLQATPVPQPLWGGTLASSFGSSSGCFSQPSRGVHLASRILCQPQCGLPSVAAIKRPFVSLPSPSARMWHAPPRTETPCHRPALSGSMELARKASHFQPTGVSPVFISLQEINGAGVIKSGINWI